MTNSIWLSELFVLGDQFGFSERLIRTSLQRLSADGWVSSERVGRRSRYSLTNEAAQETADAETRIYGRPAVEWDGQWTIVLLDWPERPAAARDRLIRHLRWQGFVPLGRSVMASPVAAATDTDPFVVTDAGDPPVGVLRGRLEDLSALTEAAAFDSAFELDTMADSYEAFVDRWSVWRSGAQALAGPEAWVLRTMLVHDFRRIRLREPNVPQQLRPSSWAGDDALELAGAIYRAVAPATSAWLVEVLALDSPPAQADRFA